MGYGVFGLIEIAIFLAMFVLALYVMLPKAVAHFNLWKKTGKSIYLSSSAAICTAGLFLLAADFVMFIKIFINGGVSCIN